MCLVTWTYPKKTGSLELFAAVLWRTAILHCARSWTLHHFIAGLKALWHPLSWSMGPWQGRGTQLRWHNNDTSALLWMEWQSKKDKVFYFWQCRKREYKNKKSKHLTEMCSFMLDWRWDSNNTFTITQESPSYSNMTNSSFSRKMDWDNQVSIVLLILEPRLGSPVGPPSTQPNTSLYIYSVLLSHISHQTTWKPLSLRTLDDRSTQSSSADPPGSGILSPICNPSAEQEHQRLACD